MMNRKFLPVFCLAVICKGILFVSGFCPNHRKNPLNVIGNRGEIRFSSSGGADCSWRLPSTPSNHHALIIFVKNADMKTTGSNRCGGNLFLPYVGVTCRSSSTCRVYVQPNSTCRMTDITDNAFQGCSRNIIHLDDKPQKDIRYQSVRMQGKLLSFTILYKFIDCIATSPVQRILKVASSRTRTTTSPSDNQVNTSASQKEFTNQEQNSYATAQAAVVVIIVILAVLLVATCVMLLLMYRRKQKAVTFQNPAVVAYVHERFEDDNGSSSQMTDYLEYPRSEESVTPPLDTVSGGIYAKIGPGDSEEATPMSEILSERQYQNVLPLDSKQLPSQSDTLVDIEFSSSCTYATVNKAFKKRAQTTS